MNAGEIVDLIQARRDRYSAESRAAFALGAEEAGYVALCIANDYDRLLKDCRPVPAVPEVRHSRRP
jgi:hypothetical protein